MLFGEIRYCSEGDVIGKITVVEENQYPKMAVIIFKLSTISTHKRNSRFHSNYQQCIDLSSILEILITSHKLHHMFSATVLRQSFIKGKTQSDLHQVFIQWKVRKDSALLKKCVLLSSAKMIIRY